MKKLGWIMLLCLCLMLSTAHADYDPKQAAIDSLTEIYGYTAEEADDFCFEDDGIQRLTFYQPGHPDWAYTLLYNAQGTISCESPFHSDYSGYPSEGNMHWFLKLAQEGQWFTHWNEENRSAVRDALDDCNITPDRQLSLALMKDDVAADQLIQAFFTSCYNTEDKWTAPMIGWRNEVLAQYGVTLSRMTDVPEKGIYEYTKPRGLHFSETTVCEFKGEVPEELQAVFQADPHLNGWTCLTGIMYTCQEDYCGYTIAAFEKDGQRLLAGFERAKGQWSVFPIGMNALFQDASLELSITGVSGRGSDFVIRYDGPNGMQAFTVSFNNPTDAVRGHCFMCSLEGYEAISADGADAVSISFNYGRNNEWSFTEQHGDERVSETVITYYPVWMGVRDIEEFPRSIAQAKATISPVPEGYAMASSVHLRKDRSSRADDLGTLLPGTLFPIMDTLPGDPYPWIRTSIGQVKGYVCQRYTSASDEPSGSIDYDYPLPVAQAKHSIDLKAGTGWFDRTVQRLEEGTTMRIIMESGDWLYVVVPCSEHHDAWVMDVDGVYGYVKKADVAVGALEIQLEWMNK